jgi:hypothetical protein
MTLRGTIFDAVSFSALPPPRCHYNVNNRNRDGPSHPFTIFFLCRHTGWSRRASQSDLDRRPDMRRHKTASEKSDAAGSGVEAPPHQPTGPVLYNRARSPPARMVEIGRRGSRTARRRWTLFRADGSLERGVVASRLTDAERELNAFCRCPSHARPAAVSGRREP